MIKPSKSVETFRAAGHPVLTYPTVRPGWVSLSFVREFTSGNLLGVMHADCIGFCSKDAAEEWVSTINRKNAAGEVDYKIVSHGDSR
jgi:uroporphyrinogen-III synthase